MRIIITPIVMSAPLHLVRRGPAKLEIDGDLLDLSALAVGTTVEEAWRLHPMLAAGSIEITGDGPVIPVLLPISPTTDPRALPAFVDVPANGPVALPEVAVPGKED